jgi:hypothetical protein
MLSNANMGRQFWDDAASAICYLINRSPSIAIEKKTPMEIWSSSPSDYSHLKVFSCTAYAHVDNGKLEYKVAKCVFLGYGLGVKRYKLWNLETKKSMLSRSVVFNESEMYYSNRATNAHDDVPQKVSMQVEHLDEGDHVIHDDVGTQDTHGLDVDSPTIVNFPILQPTQPMSVNRLIRVQKPVRRLIEECNMSFALSYGEEVDCSDEPSTVMKPFFLVIVRSGWLLCKRRCSHLRKMAHGILFGCLQRRRQFAANGFSREMKVVLLLRLPDLRQG